MSANITRKKVIIANNKIVKATLVKDFYIFKSKKLKNRLEKMKLKPNLHFSISFKALDLILHSQVCGKLFSLFSYLIARIIFLTTIVNFSPMSPKLFRTYPHREEDWGIDLTPLFL